MESQEQQPQEIKMRKMIIETDGNNLKIDRKEIPSNFELKGMLESILKQISPQ